MSLFYQISGGEECVNIEEDCVCVQHWAKEPLFSEKKTEESIWRNNSSKENLYNGGDVVYFFIYSTPENILL